MQDDESVQPVEQRGWYYPAVLIDLFFKQKEIKPVEFILLGLINSLTHKTKGCFASNNYLSTRLHRSSRQVQKMLEHLQQLGTIIVQVRRNDKGTTRHIWPTFQPDKLPKASMGGTSPMTPRGVTYDAHNSTEFILVDPLRGSDFANAKPSPRCSVDQQFIKGDLREPKYDGLLPDKEDDRPVPGGQKLTRKQESTARHLLEWYVRFSTKRRWHAGQKGSTPVSWSVSIVRSWKGLARKLALQEETPRMLRNVSRWFEKHHADEYVRAGRTFKTWCGNYPSYREAYEKHVRASGAIPGAVSDWCYADPNDL